MQNDLEIEYLSKNYKLDDNEIFVPINGEKIMTAFSKEEQNTLLELEDVSWWFQYRAEVIENIAQRYFSKELSVFDVGGGNGYTSSVMKSCGFSTCLIEPTYQACVNGKSRGINKVICGTVSKDNFENEFFSQVMMLDVLEHIEDDKDFLKTLKEKMKTGGRILITVPAFRKLWSSEDDTAGHFRRYTYDCLYETAKSAGFKIIYINYFFGFLYLPIYFGRHLGEKFGILKPTDERTDEEKKAVYDKQFKVNKGLVSAVLGWFEKRELNKINNNKRIKKGSSILCVLEK